MSRQGWLPIAAELYEFDPPVWVFGGIAEEALLEGSISQEHGDIDVLVDRNHVSEHMDSFQAIGYPPFQVLFEVVPGQPLVLGAERDGMPLEIGVFDTVGSSGDASFVLPTGDGLIRIILPVDTFSHPDIEVGGMRVRTVSPLALYHMRVAFIQTGVFGPPRDKDVMTQARLRDSLLADVPEDDLRLRTSPA